VASRLTIVASGKAKLKLFMMLACRELPSFWQLHQKWP
jgi:hypothetical protein